MYTTGDMSFSARWHCTILDVQRGDMLVPGASVLFPMVGGRLVVEISPGVQQTVPVEGRTWQARLSP